MPADRPLPDLFGELPQVTAGFEHAIRGGSLSSQIARAVGQALKGHDREQVAAAMSAWLGEKISRAMLDAYASEARTTHRITVERFMALIEATSCTALLGFVAEPFRHVVVPEEYGDIIELHQIEERERELAERKREISARRRRA